MTGIEQEQASNAAGKKDQHQYLTFTLGDEEYGIEILRVQEIKGYSAVTPIPNAPPHLKGVMNLRGTVVPVVDLRVKFGMPSQPGLPMTHPPSSCLIDNNHCNPFPIRGSSS